MSKKIFVTVVLFFLLFLCVSQVEGRNMKPVPLGTPSYSTSQSNCHENPTFPDPDSIIITVCGNDVIVSHKDALYNCCFEIRVEVVQSGNLFNLYEHTYGEECDCLCYFDVTTIHNLEPGTYTINVYNAEGEYVGGGTITIERIVPTPMLK